VSDGPQGPMFAVDRAHSSAATAPPVDPHSLHVPARSWFGQTFPGTDPPAIELACWDGKAAGLRAIKARDSGFVEGAFEAAVVGGDREQHDWAEDWVFQRPAGVTSTKATGPVSQLCPNCGAPILVDVTTICPFCGAAVISGRFQWLLTRIDRV